MGSKVVVTYKRKRLFSRSDHSPINLHSEISELKTSADFHNHVDSFAEHTLQNKDTEFETCHEYSKEKVGENMLECENCDSQYRGQCSKATELQRLCAACTQQQDSSVSNQTRNTLEQKTWSQESHVKHITFHPNLPLEGSPGETCQVDNAGESNAEEESAATQSKLLFVKSGSEYEDKCKVTFSNEDKCKGTFSNEDKCKETFSNEDTCKETFSNEDKCKETFSNEDTCKETFSKEDTCNETSSNVDKCKDTSSDEDKCKETFSILPTPDACSGIKSDLIYLKTSDGINCSHQMRDTSISGTSALEERNKLNKDQCSTLCNNLTTKRKLTSTLITFCRRSKRNRDIAANDIASECTDTCASETPLAATCSGDLKSEKVNLMNSSIGNDENKPPEDIDNSCSFSAPAAMVMNMDNPLHFPHGIAKNASTAVAQVFQNSHEEMSSLEEKVCMGVQDNHHINMRPQGLSNEDVNTRRMPTNILLKRGSVTSLDLSISPPASCEIDCNIPLDCDSDGNHLPGPPEVLHDSLGSTSKINKDIPTFQVQCAGNGSPVRTVSDKGKFILESPPVFMGTSSKNKCIQLFPENRSNDKLPLANDPKKLSQLLPPSFQSSHIHNLSLQSEQMANSRPYYSSLYEWPQIQLKEPLQDFLPSTSNRAHSFSRHLMMLDNILTRARAARGIKSGLLDKFESPTTWSEEELDCLWVGVRRHGNGNWDAILRDRRLHFSPWKMARDLADRWQEEQSRLFYGTPVSQIKYASRPDFLSREKGPVDEVQLSLGVQNPLNECGAQKRPSSIHFTNLTRNRKFQKPVANFWDESSFKADYVKGSLPHWLREAVEIPPRPSGPTQNVVSSFCNTNFDCSGNFQQPWLNTRNAPIQRRTEPQSGGKAHCTDSPLVVRYGKSEQLERQVDKQEDLIIIPSDASSEETISDDHSIRP